MKLLTCFIAVCFLAMEGHAADHGPRKPGKGTHLYISHFENVLGTSLELKISAGSQQEASLAERAAMQEINRMAKILSAYDPGSEFSRWLRTSDEPVHVSKELFEVMTLFDQWRARTGGALDPSAELIGKIWKQSAASQRIPTKEELANAVSEMKQPHWKLDAGTQTATHLSHVPLMLNSFVKSYIIKHAADAAMSSENVKAVVVNIGGDLVIAGHLDETVQVSNPQADAENETPVDQLLISNKAVATSGNYRRGELIGGHWYSHIVDPRTGQPADNIISATVVADNATDAGALATAFNVMTPGESIKLAATIPDAEYMIITRDGKKITSKGWSALEVPVKKGANDNTNKNAVAGRNDDFELLVNLEINLQKEGFAKRPYVAVWVEDENHAAVRTISVWHGSDRYMPELRSWYLKYRGLYTSDKTFSSSVTSATRSAGKYTVKWDGKDDKGNVVKPGKYIIKIEASREHGTYQLMRQEIVCDETPKKIDLTGNIEILSASLDYRKKTSGN